MFANEAARFAESPLKTGVGANSGDEAGVTARAGTRRNQPGENGPGPATRNRSFPAIRSTQVTYEGKVWTVSQINLATGEHVITRPPGLSKANLRMMEPG